MKNYIKTCIVLLLSGLLLVGCSNPTNDASNPTTGTSYSASSIPNLENSDNAPASDSHELIVPIVEECRVSSKRTGTYRQGIYALGNGFEVTDTGSYWMCNHWLFYSDHGSDTVIKLCGRPDCTHSDRDCNAYFDGGSNICYYNGYLYTFSNSGVYRVNLDGSDRLLVFDLSAFKAEQHYSGIFGPQIWNGIFSVQLYELDEKGRQVGSSFYYKLDGSMETPEKAAFSLVLIDTDGDAFCGPVGYDKEEGQDFYGIWDPDTNTTTAFFKVPASAKYYTGYIGSKAIYYIENGIIYEYTYATGVVSALFDTGLDTGPLGNYKLSCFPDTIVISEYSDDRIEDITLRFYDWNFNELGSVHIDFPFNASIASVICGETHERFMLTGDTSHIPRYYIEKSDLETGNITIHEYEWDFEWE